MNEIINNSNFYLSEIVGEMILDENNYFHKIPKDISMMISIMTRPIYNTVKFSKSLSIEGMLYESLIVHGDDIIIKQDKNITKINSKNIELLDIELMNAEYKKHIYIRNPNITLYDNKLYEKFNFGDLESNYLESNYLSKTPYSISDAYDNICIILLVCSELSTYHMTNICIYDMINNKILSLIMFANPLKILISKHNIFIISQGPNFDTISDQFCINVYDYKGQCISKSEICMGKPIDASIDHQNNQLVMVMRKKKCRLFRLSIKDIINSKQITKDKIKIIHKQFINIRIAIDPITNILYYIYVDKNNDSAVINENKTISFPLPDIYEKPLYKKGVPKFYITNSGLLLINYHQELRIYK